MTLASQAPRDEDTIAAIATPAGEGGIGIVRLSGSRAVEIASHFFVPRSGVPLSKQPTFTARMGTVVRGQGSGKEEAVDEVLALLMRAPKTYTREDMVEIQAHGGPVVLRAILELAVSAGARLAEPGEFTKRAFLGGRLDLLQAEAVLDLIHAKSEAGRSFASSQLAGGLSKKIESIREALVDVLAQLEADIDFPEDFVEPQASRQLQDRLQKVCAEMERLLNSAAMGFVAKRGVRAVIWGRPNVGKSSLLNALSQKNRVIVAPHPGTTRDIVEEEVEVAGFPVVLVDTAGVQETMDPIEKEGVERSRLAIQAADIVLHVLDASQPLSAEEKALLSSSASKPRILVLNKSDLPAMISAESIQDEIGPSSIVRVSCYAKDGLQPLEEALRLILGKGRIEASGEPVLTSLRQKDLLERVGRDLIQAAEALKKGLSAEFPASDVRRALVGLSELTGEITHDDVLDRLFSQFCIGK